MVWEKKHHVLPSEEELPLFTSRVEGWKLALDFFARPHPILNIRWPGSSNSMGTSCGSELRLTIFCFNGSDKLRSGSEMDSYNHREKGPSEGAASWQGQLALQIQLQQVTRCLSRTKLYIQRPMFSPPSQQGWWNIQIDLP